ncbi:MAG: hypothetical protein QQW96_15210 [Tychonema bourrellyi B0820]|uniref:Type II secretion system protein GspC N-terminal domain-containing protein n=1 Tax=Tychonema bourrellyi FEM_GT703 TaxID=2040638 RepID=A0A2G4F361_9CYAN|nr:hypothetical protein [Tychonema bourrellyi]MDQ2098981.1 hypothetical protein [Tychonema bourrellyi B0820]PHX56186.1 hypothetical protein CP500_006670 [Tychonema bourrellyi FEM_GT703]
MSQNVTAKQMGLESAQDPIAVVATVETIPAETVAVESYADRLMDELFEGVDRAFQESGGLPTEPVKPEIITLKSISVPQIVLSSPPPMGGQRLEKDVVAIARRVALETTKKHQSKQSFDKMLLGAAFGSLLLVLGLWLASRSGWVRLPVAATTTGLTPTTKEKTAPDTEFSEYVQRSLDAIEQKKLPKGNAQLSGVPEVVPPGTLPNISISGAPPATAGLSTAVNRIADALEQAAVQPGSPALPAQVVIIPPATNPAEPPPTVAVSPSATAPASGRAVAVAGKASPSSSPVAASPSKSSEPKILARETEPATAPAAAPAATQPAATQPAAAPAATQPAAAQTQPTAPAVVSSAPTSAHTLVGVLELGDRSAALFEVDGVARRIYVGESIGSSGWTLGEIKNQEAVIRKGGDVRSVFVGQKF